MESFQRNIVVNGDSIRLLAEWPEHCVNLAFADPPYNIGYVYDKYDDDRPDHEYVEWCRQWMKGVHRVLTPDGSFYLAIGDDFAADLRILGRELGFHLRNWIIWHYTFGQNCRTKFGRAHTHILYFTKDAKRFTFNDHLLRYPSARHTEYQDLRASPDGRVHDDVWDDIPRVCGTFKERAGFHGCQLPETLLMRIIMASSNPGDVVLDPFIGSGTTAAVAKRLGRAYVGIDLSPEYVEQTRKRLEAVRDESRLQRKTSGAWPAFHEELLCMLYRETKVVLANLLPNKVALKVIAGSLKQRCGAKYTPDEVRSKLSELRQQSRLPKVANDGDFEARAHRASAGKKYKRTIFRVRARKNAGATPPDESGRLRFAQ